MLPPFLAFILRSPILENWGTLHDAADDAPFLEWGTVKTQRSVILHILQSLPTLPCRFGELVLWLWLGCCDANVAAVAAIRPATAWGMSSSSSGVLSEVSKELATPKITPPGNSMTFPPSHCCCRHPVQTTL